MDPTPSCSHAGRRLESRLGLTGAAAVLLTLALVASRPVPMPAAGQVASLSANELRPGPRQFRGQLRPGGRWLLYPDGSRFRWRGVTGFMLNEQVAGGREAEAEAFLKWATQTGFNVVRVLVMLPKGWFTDRDFTPEEGLAALPRTLELARGADMYLEVTVLANTASLPAKADLGSYVERAGRICAAASNCALVEVANEFSRAAQRADVRDPGNLARLAARVPAGIPTALGATAASSASLVAAAPVITINVDGAGERWSRLGRMQALGEESERTGRFVIDNGSIRADELEQPGERDNLPDVFFAQGALSRVFEVGSNFHFENGLRAKVPGSIQQECADAFIAGTRIVNDEYMLTFQDTGSTFSPVRQARAGAAYAGLTQVFPAPPGPTSVLVLVGIRGEPGVEWRSPWQQAGVVAARPQVQVWSIARGQRPVETP
jgi:hypothetical protein